MNFFEGGMSRLAVSAVTKDAPAYVQFYITARCNLRCEQCNVIYANADQQEATTDQCRKIAANLAKIGTSVVLLTGGEPFVRKDIVEIAEAFIHAGVHPRLQTNGLAKRNQLEDLARIGAHDISISLDSVVPSTQDIINGNFNRSWRRAIETMANVNAIFPNDSFAVIGCVLAPRNIDHIHAVIEFATHIGWHVSLVPAHTTPSSEPRSFRTFDPALKFPEQDYPRVFETLEKVKTMRRQGFNVYDSDEYLDDIYRFITGQPIQWRRRNDGVCDAPNLYFAIQPNGDMAVCCDFRLSNPFPVYAEDFPVRYRDRTMRAEALSVARACSGCMYGSFPEISISSRFLTPMLHRAKLFLLNSGGKRSLNQLTADQMVEAAHDIAGKYQLA